jgi:hypothetical protein
MRALCVFLLLAGCAAPDEHTPQAFCAAAANRDPAVKALMMHGVSNPSFINQSGSEIAAAKSASVRDCLKRQGIVPASDGVQGTPHGDTLFQ